MQHSYRLVFILFLVLIEGRISFGDISSNPYNIQSFQLKNGLEVIHIPNNRAPVIMQAVCYKIGSADDPKGKSGVAHYLEHLMFRGTRNHKDGVFKKKITEIGGVSNAFTDQDSTLYFQIFSKNHLEEMMALEADRMGNFEPSPESFESEKKIVLEEYHMRTGNSKYQQLTDAINAAFFSHHPYRIPIIGWWEELRQISRDDALQFHKDYYGPNNAILCISGDVDFETVKNLAQKYYGPIQPRILTLRNRVQEPKHHEETLRIEMRHREAPNKIDFIYEVPNFRLGDRKEVLSLTLFQSILGDDSSGLLFKYIAQKENLAHAATSWYISNSYDPYSFGIELYPEAHFDYKITESVVPLMLRQIIETELTEETISKAKKNLIIKNQEKMSELNTVTTSILLDMSQGKSLKDIMMFERELSEIMPNDVKFAAKKYLSDSPRLISVGISLPKVEYNK